MVFWRMSRWSQQRYSYLDFPGSQVSTPFIQNTFSGVLSPFGFDFHGMLTVDLLHEVELGMWKALLTHLIRILHTGGADNVHVFDERYGLHCVGTWPIMLTLDQLSFGSYIWQSNTPLWGEYFRDEMACWSWFGRLATGMQPLWHQGCVTDHNDLVYYSLYWRPVAQATQYFCDWAPVHLCHMACSGETSCSHRHITRALGHCHNHLGKHFMVLFSGHLPWVWYIWDKRRVHQTSTSTNSSHLNHIKLPTFLDRPSTPNVQPQNDQASFPWRLRFLHQDVWNDW